MSLIGYSSSGYAELASEIRIRKQKLLDILNSFVDVDNAIAACWDGEDAQLYREELTKVIEATKNSVIQAYDTLGNQCRITYEEWESKQRMS